MRLLPALGLAATLAIGAVGCGDDTNDNKVPAAGSSAGSSSASNSEAIVCTADARIGPDGKLYGRDPAHECKFVDDHGNELPGQ